MYGVAVKPRKERGAGINLPQYTQFDLIYYYYSFLFAEENVTNSTYYKNLCKLLKRCIGQICPSIKDIRINCYGLTGDFNEGT